MLADGMTPGHIIANGTAARERPTAGRHGFVLAIVCGGFQSEKHRFDVQCYDPVHNRWAELKNSPFCTTNGKKAPC